MNKNKKQKIINQLKKEKSKYKGVMTFHLNNIIKDVEGYCFYKTSREYIEDVTGIKIRKVGNFIF